MSGPVDQTALLKRAYLKLEELQAKLDAAERARTEPLAIVGIGCRFPGAGGPDEFWALLRDGVDAVRPTPKDRWDFDRHFDPTPGTPGKMYSRAGAFLDRVDLFEPQFFGISPREAIGMDPQQRLLLEVTWEALEHAGIAPDRLVGSRTGVFVGICTGDYSHLQVKSGDATRFDAYYGSGIAHSVASGRLSYVLGLQGPSVSIDTACSSSLVALHLACRSLRSGESKMAIVGGVNLILSPENSITFSRSTMLAHDGRCKTFDASADGFGEGEGCAVIVLKRLSDAVADGDRVLALVRGTALNQDGASSGLTAPNGPAQVAVIREALADGRVAAADIAYIEAHGTGTTLGDPIEVQAIGTALGQGRVVADAPVLLGSVKTNLAHLEAAAGLAGVIKVVLSLQHRLIPRHLHFTTPNPHIAWSELPVRVVTENTEWKPLGGTRLAGVSAFGFSGTNAHVVLEQAPEAPASTASEFERPLQVLTMSARSDSALRAVARAYAERLRASTDEAAFPDVCHTAAVGRAQMGHRAAFVAASRADALSHVDAWLSGQGPSTAVAGELSGVDRPRVGFLFTGQGSQYAGMGRQLYDTHPVFRHVLDTCDRILRDRFGRALLPVMFAAPGTPEQPLLDDTAYTQPAIFALQCGLVELWKTWGIRPSAVLGHSVGEFAAAYAAGVFSLEDGFALIAERARLMQALPRGGKMAAVFADEARVARVLGAQNARVSIAAINGPENSVISGEGGAIDALCAQFKAEGIGSKTLTVSHAFHSPLMEPMLQAFERAAAGVELRSPAIVVLSNVTGRAAGPGDLTTASYWTRHVRHAVRFADSVAALSATGCGIVVEIGPQPTLISMARACLAGQQPVWLPSLRRGQDEWAQMLGTLAELFVRGADVDWVAFDKPYARRRVALPTYPFERERYWIAPVPEDAPRERTRAEGVHPLLGSRVDSAASGEVLFVGALDTTRVPFLRDHVVHGVALLPTTGYLEMAVAAARECLGAAGAAVRDLSILEPLFVSAGGPTPVQVVCGPVDDRRAIALRVFSRQPDADTWSLHASGVVEAIDGCDGFAPAAARAGERVDVNAFYEALATRGLEFGDGFKGVREILRADGEATGLVALPDGYPDAHAYSLHPALLDACLQVLAVALPGFSTSDGSAAIYMPIALDRFELLAPAAGPLRCTASIPGAVTGAETLTASVEVFTAAGEPVARLRGLHLKRAERTSVARRHADEIDDWLYEVEWRPEPLSSAPGELVSALATRARALAEEHGVAVYDRLNRDLDALCAAYACQALNQLGATFEPGGRIEAAALGETLGVRPQHGRLLARLLEILGEEGILSRAGEAWTVARVPETNDASALADEMLSRWPAQRDELEITRRCGDRLAEALRGEQDPLQLLFPGGDIDRTARIYDSSPLARTFNTLAREALLACLAGRRPDTGLRVLEVGAGTGGTTQYLLDALPPGSEYVYTDQGQAFLARAPRRFADYPFVSYRPLDIEKDPAAQGFTPDSFDVVVAANVLHATNSIGDALARVRQLLKPGGILLLVEGTRPQRWFDLTFGLTDGWWRFEDVDCRPSYPLVSRSGWRAALERGGFEGVAMVPDHEDGTALTQTAVIVARANATAAAARPAPGVWVIYADRSGFGDRVAARLSEDGAQCLLVHRGTSFGVRRDGGIEIDPWCAEDYRRVIARAVENGSPCKGAIHCWSLDAAAGLDADGVRVQEAEEIGCRTALHAIQALLTVQPSSGLQCCLVTRGVQAGGIDGLDAAVPHATMWGLARSVALEHPDLRMLRVDLDPSSTQDEANRLAAELYVNIGEEEVAYRDGRRFVARLTRAAVRARESERAQPDTPRRLVTVAAGTTDGVGLARAERRAPRAGEVEVRVRAAALNFRDVLNVLGMRQDDDPLGGECAGIVERVGAGVERVRPGDAVVVIAAGCFADYVTAPATLVFPMPRRLTDEQAAAAPLALLTARYALEAVGKLARGERVLIHAAAGGVGLAAVQIARRLGAEVFGTAGSPEKRAFLQSIGVQRVADSRTLDFASQIAEWTNGEGVDLVLNSLTGPAIDAGVQLLRAGGRFLEIGKSDLRAPEAIAHLNPAARYEAIDLAGTLHEQPASLRPLVADLLAQLDSGDLDPLPVSVFDIDAAADAFRHMARARHIGKVVLRVSADPRAAQTPRFRPDATYVITGGLNGIGLEVARWMTGRGARHLGLLGRRAPDAEAVKALEVMRGAGVRVMPLQADVTDARQLREAFTAICGAMPPIRGVIHSAGVLDDGVVMQQDWGRFRRVLAPKVDGAWHLHELTRGMPLDFFVLFSSASSLLGSAGQSNHSAANAFLDALAHHRRAAGQPGLSINWGAWSEIGAAARRGVEQRIEGHGIRAFSPEQGLRALARLLDGDAAQVGVLPVDWSVFARQHSAGGISPFFSDLARQAQQAVRRAARSATARQEPAANVVAELKAMPAHKRRVRLSTHVEATAVRVLGLPPQRPLDRRLPLSEMGLDSLMAVELRNALGTSMEMTLPATLLFDHPSVDALVDYLFHTLGFDAAEPVPPQQPSAGTAADLLAFVEALSEEDIDRLVTKRGVEE